MNKQIFRIGIPVFVILYAFTTVKAQPFPKSPQPWHEDYNISLKNFEFKHPMTVINQEDLATVKNRIQNRIEPQYSAYQNLIDQAESQLSFVPDPPNQMTIMGGYEPNSNLSEMRDWLWRNSHAAYTCGLAYAYSGESKYAEKAIEVLMKWANKGTEFDGNDSGLQLGSWFSPMLYAADLIHHYEGWAQADRDKFKSWWQQNCLIRGEVLDVMRRKDNNWKDAGVLGTLSAAVVLEDTLYLKEAIIQLMSYFYKRTDNWVQIEGTGWKIESDNNGVYLPREVVRNDGRSGLTYTAYALTTMVQCLEIARYAGFNFWHKQTPDGVGLVDVINQYFRWDKLGESFPWHNSPNKSDKRENCYELANTFLDVLPELKTYVMDNWPVLTGREGDEYCSLNKGDLLGTGITPPSAPDNLKAEAVSDKQINLSWSDNSDNEEGFTVLRRSETSSYITVGKVDSNITTFQDKFFLSSSTLYFYRVKAYRGKYESTYSNEASDTTLSKGQTSVEHLNNLPMRFKLEQNYPNPFNSSTMVSYKLADDCHVQLKIINISGQLVDVLVDEFQNRGSYVYHWQCSSLSSGIYFCQLNAGNYHEISKLVYQN